MNDVKDSRAADSAGSNLIEIFYHGAAAGFTGRSESLLTMLSYSGEDYVLKMPQEVGWRSDSPQNFVGMGPPFLRTDGFLVSQRGACMVTLGKKLGFYPKTAADEAHALQLSMNVTDVMAEKGKRMAMWNSIFESFLAANPDHANGGFVFGSSVTYADFDLFLATCLSKQVFNVEVGPLQEAHYNMLMKNEGLKAFKATGIKILP